MNNQLLEFYRRNHIPFNITVSGECMKPIINNKDEVYVFPQDDYKIGDIAVCIDYNNLVYMHRIQQILYKDGKTKYITKADNNICEDKHELDKDRIIGKVQVEEKI